MFRLGISVKDIKAIVVRNIDEALMISEALKKDNITEINGIPAEEIIFVVDSPEEVINISMDTNKNIPSLAQMRKERPEEIEGRLYPNTINYIKRTRDMANKFKDFAERNEGNLPGTEKELLSDSVYLLHRSLFDNRFFQNWDSLLYELDYLPKDFKERYITIITNNLERILEILPEFMKKVAILSTREKIIPLENLREYNFSYPSIKKSIKNHINVLRELPK